MHLEKAVVPHLACTCRQMMSHCPCITPCSLAVRPLPLQLSPQLQLRDAKVQQALRSRHLHVMSVSVPAWPAVAVSGV